MKKTLITGVLALSVLLVPSCANLANLDRVAYNEVGSVAQVIPGTVVSARTVRIDASSSDKNLGTALGTAIGAGSGALLGKGKGQIVSAVGFGALGALAGRGVSKYANQADGQELVIQADKGGAQYRVTQPVYEQMGIIPVGTHGNLQYGGSGSKFLPDGY